VPKPGTELRRAMEALLEGGVALRHEPPPGYAGLRELYGSNAAIADAAGLPTAGRAVAAYRARYPHARATSLARVSRDARRERQGFLRNLQRYQRGERRPDKIRPVLERLRRRGMDRLRRQGVEFRDATSLAKLARVMVDRGVTIPAGWWGVIRVSDDERERTPPGVAFYPLATFAVHVERGEWAVAAEDLFDAWGHAYGLGACDVLEVEDLELEAGLDPDASYGP